MNQSLINYQAEFKELGLDLVLGELTALARKSVSKARHNKPVFNYRFRNAEQMDSFLSRQLDGLKKIAENKKEREEIKKAARENMNHGYQVGDVIYDSWGYDQTNIDFYQIIEVKPKSLVIQAIHEERVAGYGDLSGNVKPVKGFFHGEPMVKPICIMVDSCGKVIYFIRSKHGWINKYDRGEDGVYESHYA